MFDWLRDEWKTMAAASRGAPFALDLSEEKVILRERRGAGWIARATVRHDAADFKERIAGMRNIAKLRLGGKAPVDLLLPSSLTLHRVDTFPAEAGADLREAVWWRLGSLTKLEPEELCFDVAKLSVDPDTGFLELGVAISQKEIAQEAIDFAKKWGFDPQRVTSSTEIEGFPDGPTFARVEDFRAETRSMRWTAATLSIAALLLVMAGVARGVLERTELADAAEARRIVAEQRLAEAQSVREQSLVLAEMAEKPVFARAERPLAMEWLGALARTLPPSAFAERVMVADGVVRLEGVAENADAVLAAVEVAPEFETARYAAALTSASDGGWQRFAIEAALVDVEASP